MVITRPADVINVALILVLYGLAGVLALPGSTFQSAPGYALMAQLASEGTWSIAFVVVATLGVFGMRATNRLGRIFAVIALSLTHGLLGALLLFGNPYGFGVVLCAPYAALGGFLVMRELAR